MSPLPIDYATATAGAAARLARPPGRSRLTHQQKVTAALAAAVLIAAAFAGCKSVRTDIDAVTGSTTTRTSYALGLTFGPPEVKTSALEQRLRAIGASWRPRWQHLSTTDRGPFGFGRGCGCSTAPPVDHFPSRSMGGFVAAASNAEVVAFVRTMESGTPANRRDAVAMAVDKVMPGFYAATSRPAPSAAAATCRSLERFFRLVWRAA